MPTPSWPQRCVHWLADRRPCAPFTESAGAVDISSGYICITTVASSGFEEGAQPVQHQIRSLFDDPVADAVDQLDVEIVDVLGISVDQVRREHRVGGAA